MVILFQSKRKIKTRYIILHLFIVAILIFVAIYRSEVIYGLRQAKGQLSIVFNTKPIEEVLKDDNFPAIYKKKLRLVAELRQFAIDSLGLDDTENYKTFYDQKGQDILWIVKACPEFELKPYIWDFPFAGKFSYKGFFEKDKVIEEAERLKSIGYDVRISTVGGWSTLGILKDPILSNMLNRSEGALAELIFHELTHATIFLKDSLQYNENLATFIGEEGARYFLISKYGKNSNEYKAYVNKDGDYRMYSQHLLKGAKKLNSLYNNFNNSLTDSAKRLAKQNLIRQIIKQTDTIPFYFRDNYMFLKDTTFMPNNAYFIGYMIYRDDLKHFYIEFKQKGNSTFKQYIKYLKQKHDL